MKTAVSSRASYARLLRQGLLTLGLIAGLLIGSTQTASAAARVWTYGDGLICEINPVTGVEIFSFPTGSAAAIQPGLAYDGTNLLYTDEHLDVVKVFALDGTLLGTIGKLGGMDSGSAGLGASSTDMYAVGAYAPDAGIIRTGSTADGVETSSCALSGATQGLTYASTRGTIFASADNGSGPELVEANLDCSNPRTMSVGNLYRGLCYSVSDDAIYAVKSGLLFKLDPDTGNVLSGYPVQVTALADGHFVNKTGACAADETEDHFLITRTLGYWKNHPTVIDGSFDGPDGFPSLLPFDFCGMTIDTSCKAVELLSLGGGGLRNFKRQAVAAILNCKEFGGCSDDILKLIDDGSAACAAGDRTFGFGDAGRDLDIFNNSGDLLSLPFQSPSALPHYCQH